MSGQPGITIPELAAKMGIKQNYLYRVLPGLEQEKKIKKQGRGWHPVLAVSWRRSTLMCLAHCAVWVLARNDDPSDWPG